MKNEAKEREKIQYMRFFTNEKDAKKWAEKARSTNWGEIRNPSNKIIKWYVEYYA